MFQYAIYQRNIPVPGRIPGSTPPLVEIVLDSQENIFAPGQTITGHVAYNVIDPPQNLKSTSITLEGRGKIITEPNYSGGSSNNLDTEIFREERSLFQGPFTNVKPPLTWPFEFTLPKVRTVNGKEWPLPPSITLGNESKFAQRFGFTVSISYVLQVHIEDGTNWNAHQNYSKALVVRPILTEQPPLAQMESHAFELVSSHSHGGFRERMSSMKLKLQGLAKNDDEHKEPSVDFEATISMPSMLWFGQAERLLISLQHKTSTPSDLQRPTLVLEDVELTLHTIIKSINESVQTRKYGSTTFHPKARLSLDSETLELARDFGMSSLTTETSFWPDFESTMPYIVYTHSIQAVAKIRHEESGHAFTLKCQFPVQALPRRQPGARYWR
ncbi:hypothetical protein NA57DRAFT_79303 [Rhizodiscina lignyota]|uniref:Arrestin-like N-terminal domain-containing protein n=1 Tax=Rhizodiscina lignyota TaxID=1504668 RepID=A0A9P4IAX8_9PEZI|nr:hypothetical protein NA57DRAFT_79303 [Rhizodiscina lignyota]